MKLKEIIYDPRRRVILVTVVTASILLLLIAALIVTTVGSKNRLAKENDSSISTPIDDRDISSVKDETLGPVDNSETGGIVAVKPSEDASASSEQPVKPAEDKVKPAAPATTEQPSISSAPASSAAPADNLPKTGPESLIGISLLAGSAVAYLLSRERAFAKLYRRF